MLPKAPLEEIIQALEGCNDVVFNFCPALLSGYLHPAQVSLVYRLNQIAQSYLSIENSLKDQERISCRYTRSLFRGVKEASAKYKQKIRQLEAELIDPCLSLTAFNHLERYDLALEKIDLLIKRCIESYSMTTIDTIFKESSALEPFTRDMFAIIRKFAIKPLLDDIWFWVSRGFLDKSQHGKFFIRKDRNGFIKFFPEEVPSFIEQSVARKIFFCGKVVRPLIQQEHTNESLFGSEETQFFREFQSAFGRLNIDRLEIDSIVEKIRAICADFSLRELMEKQNFWKYLRIIKELILGGNEDLIESIITSIEDDSRRSRGNKQQVHKGMILSLNNILSDSFNYDQSGSLAEFFTIGKSFDSQGDRFSSLNIKFSFPTIMEKIVKREHILIYNQLFRFYLLLHSSKLVLNRIWLKFMKKRKKSNHWFLLHRLVLIIGHIYYFYKINVVERLYHKFRLMVKTCHDIDTLEAGHSEFVNNLFAQSFLNVDSVSFEVLKL
ncbi:gamma-tubulin complex component 4-like [Brevipalpus obovatus]|uniref:gamma-tubulin complex component 4-like n=1 Tax=Brevipalpus obovatus TaxID=246614 RepID=UPI003D9DB90A